MYKKIQIYNKQIPFTGMYCTLICYHLTILLNKIMSNWFEKMINEYSMVVIPARNIVFLLKMGAAPDHNVAVNSPFIKAQSSNSV